MRDTNSINDLNDYLNEESPYNSINNDNHDREHVGKSSLWQVIFQYVNAVVGSGILALSYAFYRAGFILGMLMLIFIVFLTDVTVKKLVALGVKERVQTYEQLMDKLFGTKGYVCICVLLFLYDFGAMLSYLIIIADSATSVVYVICTEGFDLNPAKGLLSSEWGLRRICILIISFLLILPLIVQRNIAALETFSKYSVFSSLLMIAIMSSSIISGNNCGGDPDKCPDTSETWLTVVGDSPATAFGIIAFGFVSHDTAFMLRNSLKRVDKWGKTTDISLAISMAICLSIAIPGFIGFRDKIEENILKNFSPYDPAIVAVRILLFLNMVSTYPLCFFISRHAVNELINRWNIRGDTSRIRGTPAGLCIHRVSFRRHITITLVLFLSSVGISLCVKDLGIVMALTGNISAVSVAFILPPLCVLASNKKEFKNRYDFNCSLRHEEQQHQEQFEVQESRISIGHTKNYDSFQFLKENFWNYLIAAFGIFALVFCTYNTIKS